MSQNREYFKESQTRNTFGATCGTEVQPRPARGTLGQAGPPHAHPKASQDQPEAPEASESTPGVAKCRLRQPRPARGTHDQPEASTASDMRFNHPNDRNFLHELVITTHLPIQMAMVDGGFQVELEVAASIEFVTLPTKHGSTSPNTLPGTTLEAQLLRCWH